MALIHERSCLCLSTQLDLFSVPGTQTSQEKSIWVPYYPLTNTTDQGPIEFDVKPSPHYTDLSDTRLYIRARILNHDGTTFANETAVSTVNMPLHALFSKVDVYMCNRMITQSTGTYPWKAALETLLNFGYDAKTTQLNTIMYYKDNGMAMNDANASAEGTNFGLTKRWTYTAGSRYFELYGPLHVDLFFQEKYLLSNVPIRIKLTRSASQFVLMSDMQNQQFKIEIAEAVLWMRHVQIAPSVALSHEKALMTGNALYPVNRTEMEVLTIPSGARTIARDNFFSGKIPKKLIFVMLDNDAMNGSYTRNPFNFQHYRIQSIELTVDGEPVAGCPLTLDMGQNRKVRAFNNLFNVVGKSYTDVGQDITYDDFSHGYSIFCFDLTPDGCGNTSRHFELSKTGNLRLKLQFEANLAATINVLVYGEFENVIEITRTRELLMDFKT